MEQDDEADVEKHVVLAWFAGTPGISSGVTVWLQTTIHLLPIPHNFLGKL